MPCYCDTPDEENQAEIEKRCKMTMYLDAPLTMTKEQLQECEKINIKMFPIDNINDQLCKICKIMTKEQMEKISAFYYQIKWPHRTLYDWHLQHCKEDKEQC
jgi:hypothetical protein